VHESEKTGNLEEEKRYVFADFALFFSPSFFLSLLHGKTSSSFRRMRFFFGLKSRHSRDFYFSRIFRFILLIIPSNSRWRFTFMKQKTKTLLITYIAALFVVLAGFAFRFNSENAALRSSQLDGQRHAIPQLADSLAGMTNSLRKGVYAGSPELMASVSAEIWNDSASAIAATAALPLSEISLEKTQSFISRAGDYANYLTRLAARHTEMSEEERQNLKTMADTAEKLSQSILTLEDDIYAGNINFDTKDGELSSGVNSFAGIEKGFTSYKGINYDGAMSANIARRTAMMTAGGTEIDKTTHASAAAKALGVESGSLKLNGEGSGTIPCYCYSTEDGVYADFSKTGGYLLSMRKQASSAEYDKEIGIDEALKAAQDYLKQQNYTGLKQSYYSSDGGTATFRFVHENGGVRYYPDQITVGVSLSDGSVVSFNASDYVMNHYEREEMTPAVTSDDAMTGISGDLDATYNGLAVINSPGMNEVLCHEYICTAPDGQKILIYADAATGNQCKMMFMNDDNGSTSFS
jgi:germination protein YpeB